MALQRIYPVKDVLQAAFQEELSADRVRDGNITVDCRLAAAYGTLNKESVTGLDDNTKVTIFGVTKLVNELTVLNWNELEECMLNNQALQPERDVIAREDKLTIKDKKWFIACPPPDQDIVKVIKDWLVGLISDDDVLTDTNIDFELVEKIAAVTGVRIRALKDSFTESEYEEREVFDLGIIRYPDEKSSHFKVYRISLNAWRSYTKHLYMEFDKNGIKGNFKCHKFFPNEAKLDMKIDFKKEIAKEAEELFR